MLAIVTCVPAAAQTAPDDGAIIAQRFRSLRADTRWRLVHQFPMDFDTFHPQGMTIVDDRIYISSVEVLDRRAGKGKAHLFETDLDGHLLRRVELTDGKRYHPGGIDFDGERIWVPVAEYEPDSSATVFVVDPDTLTPRQVFTFDDHLGGVVHDAAHHRLIANSWGSRRFYTWETQRNGPKIEVVDPRSAKPVPNPSHYVDFQDGQWLKGTEWMVCSGVKRYRLPGPARGSLAIGGLELFNTRTLAPAHQVPVLLRQNERLPMTQNPVYVQATATGLRVYFMPADNESTVFVYEPVLE